jgi:hypothetical protein
MRSLTTYRAGLVAVLALPVFGCSQYSGIVVDTRGRPVAHAKVLGMDTPPVITGGERVETVTDSAGRFALTSAGPLAVIIATSPDEKRRAYFTVGSSKRSLVITVK